MSQIRRSTRGHRARGFALLEVVFALVIVGVLVRYATIKWTNPVVLTIGMQAQGAAELVRRAQAEAMVRGQRMGASVTTAGADGVLTLMACPGGTCTAEASFAAQQGASLTGAAVYFNSRGTPVDSAGAALAATSTFTLAATEGATTITRVLSVDALSGRVSVAP